MELSLNLQKDLQKKLEQRTLNIRSIAGGTVKRVDPSIAAILLLLATALGRAAAQDHAAVGGVVYDLQGIPQLGALVELLGPGSSVIAHTYTDDHGHYLLQVPQAGRYQLRTSAAFLLPALRRNLRIGTGGKTLANVTLSGLFEASDWFPVEKRSQTAPTDDWRWTLRSSAERPLLRLTGPVDDPQESKQTEQSGAPRQREQVRVQFGAAGETEDGIRQSWQMEREGESGGVVSVAASVGVPAGSDRAPAVILGTGLQQTSSFTHSQYRAVAGFASLPEVLGAGGTGYEAATLATGERVVLGDLVTIDAGTLLSAERLVASRMSAAPFLRVVVQPASDLAVMYRYAGSRAVQTLDDVAPGSVTPTPLSEIQHGEADGRPVGRAGTHQELAVSRSTERDVTTVTIYQDVLSTGMLEGEGAFQAQELVDLPVVANGGSGHFVMAVDGYTARGADASWTHILAPQVKARVEAAFGTTLSGRGCREGQQPEPTEQTALRSLGNSLAACSRPALTAGIAGNLPRTATTFEVRYHWQPKNTLTVINSFDTPANEAYASLLVRQRVWRGDRLRSINAVLEASNLLEEGYQPVIGPDGETLFLAQVPRAVQAGLAFSF